MNSLPHPHRVYVRAECSGILPAAWFIGAATADDRQPAPVLIDPAHDQEAGYELIAVNLKPSCSRMLMNLSSISVLAVKFIHT